MPTPPLGVFGGIFDPVHNGHLAAARLALDYFGFDAVHLFPAGIPPHKPRRCVAPAKHRLAMLRRAVRGDPRLIVHDDELRRGGTSYTIETLRSLGTRYPGRRLYFLIGSDNLAEIPTWRCWKEILAMVTLCVGHRPGHPLAVPRILAHARIAPFPSPEWGVSSTLLRGYLRKGYRCTGMMPEPVIAYIRNHHLYRTAR